MLIPAVSLVLSVKLDGRDLWPDDLVSLVMGTIKALAGGFVKVKSSVGASVPDSRQQNEPEAQSFRWNLASSLNHYVFSQPRIRNGTHSEQAVHQAIYQS